MVTTPLKPITGAGLEELLAPLPQHSTVPLAISAHEWVKPPAMATTRESPPTATGVDELVVVPFPNCPPKLPPQHLTVPFAKSAHECATPPEIVMAATFVRLLTATGVDESVVVPFPS